MRNITPRTLTYLSIFLAIIVIIATVAIILFPNFFKKRDTQLEAKWDKNIFLQKLAIFINNAITPLSISIFYVIISIILIMGKQYRILWIWISSILLVSILFRSIKRITQRKRPSNAEIKFKDFSFPSWHTGAWFVFFLSIAIAITRLLNIQSYEWIFLVALICWAIVARSRRYIHVHRVSDVIIWSLLWIGCFILAYLFFFYFGDAIFQAIENVFFNL